ncbi:hypothetical protein JNUCC31_02970 [Paenibacillus sp. JNUCC31]|uniref:hypothetical protein n=1 Tax=Paenibacillus sp. JNUCC-31 TaxID=2777983 RepID=UPI00177EDD59|nr:hypothetical protein [Paenibacillus sp. JNUCC-31]QOS79928.1 hypothetical protein JNUCC31_02970 [Paenibacillus sp. JNUCC-31]
MNQQLSRMKTYGRQRHRNSDKTETSERSETSQVNLVVESAAAAEVAIIPQITSVSIPRSQRKSNITSLESPVLPQRAPARTKKAQNPSEESVSEAGTLPTRTELHPSRRLRLSKRFVNSLIFIFILLTISLIWWGVEGAPPLNTFLPWPW